MRNALADFVENLPEFERYMVEVSKQSLSFAVGQILEDSIQWIPWRARRIDAMCMAHSPIERNAMKKSSVMRGACFCESEWCPNGDKSSVRLRTNNG